MYEDVIVEQEVANIISQTEARVCAGQPDFGKEDFGIIRSIDAPFKRRQELKVRISGLL